LEVLGASDRPWHDRACSRHSFPLKFSIAARIGLFVRRDGFLLLSPLAFVVVVHMVTGAAHYLDTAVTIGSKTMIASDWAHPGRFGPYGIQHVDARDLHIQFCPCVFVEQR
jgi:hypothetical protein